MARTSPLRIVPGDDSIDRLLNKVEAQLAEFKRGRAHPEDSLLMPV